MPAWISFRVNHIAAILAVLLGIGTLVYGYFPAHVSEKIATPSITHWGGYAYEVATPEYFHGKVLNMLFGLQSDSLSSPTVSKLQLFEQGVPLGQAHSLHADIEAKGDGRFSHWNNYLIFSASNNSNPMDNGRSYSVRYPIAPVWWLPIALLGVGYIGLFFWVCAAKRQSANEKKPAGTMFKVSKFLWALPKSSNHRYLFWITALILWLYWNLTFLLLLPAPMVSRDSWGYLTWSMFRTVGYPALLDFYIWLFGSWEYLPIFQLNIVLAGLFALSYAIAKILSRYIIGWLFLLLVSSLGVGMLLIAAQILTEGVFAGFVMMHLACMYLFLNGSKTYTGLLAGLSLAAAVLIKSVATVFLGPVVLFLIILPRRRMVVFVLILVPVVAAWLAPSVYNYTQRGFFDSSSIGGYALGGYVAWGIHPHDGGAYLQEAKLIEQRLGPILAKRPKHFSSVADYQRYTADEYNILLWVNMVPALNSYYTRQGFKPDICDWDSSVSECRFTMKINDALFHLGKEAIVSNKQQYAYLVAVNYGAMWEGIFYTRPEFLQGTRYLANSLPLNYANLPRNIRQFLGELPLSENITSRIAATSGIGFTALKRTFDLLTLRKNLPFAKWAEQLNLWKLYALGAGLFVIGFLASIMVSGLRRLTPAAQAFCYTGLLINAYCLGTALAQPALGRYAWPMQGAAIALFVIGIFLVGKNAMRLYATNKQRIFAFGARILGTGGRLNDR